MITALVVIGCLVTYGLIGTLAGVAAYNGAAAAVDRHSCGETPGWCRCTLPNPEDRGLFVGAAWPIGVWFLLAWALIARTERRRAVDAERRRLIDEAMAELDQRPAERQPTTPSPVRRGL